MGGFHASASNSSPEQSEVIAASSKVAVSPRQIQPTVPPVSSQLFKALVAKSSSFARQLRETLYQCLTADSQPQVKWWRDAQGHDHYSVYDPHRQQTHDFATAHEVRVWLEQRYYQ